MRELKNSLFPFLILVTLSLLFYSWATNRLAVEEEGLLLKEKTLQETLAQLKKENLLLKEQLASMNDPSGEEYMLRKELGLCPKNGKILRFVKEKNDPSTESSQWKR